MNSKTLVLIGILAIGLIVAPGVAAGPSDGGCSLHGVTIHTNPIQAPTISNPHFHTDCIEHITDP